MTAEWGNVPVMGYARVTESNVEGIAVGSRYYGWYPMATGVDVLAVPTRDGFRDDGAHRAPHAAAYRGFTATDRDPMATSTEDEPRHALLRGLFVTGFLADAFFAADGYFGAEQAVVLSASSKTAIGYAASAALAGSVRLVGVTSAGNADFVRGVGYYDDVLTYDQLADLAAVPSVVIDMAGLAAAVAAVHAHLGDDVRYSMVVGKSHRECPARPGRARADTGDVLRTRRRGRSPRRVGCGGLPAASPRLARDVHRRQLRLAHHRRAPGSGGCSGRVDRTV